MKEIQDTGAKLEAERKAAHKNEETIVHTREQINKEEDELPTYKSNKFKFTKGATDNIMDYNKSLRKCFSYWQWDIMQNDVMHYYEN